MRRVRGERVRRRRRGRRGTTIMIEEKESREKERREELINERLKQKWQEKKTKQNKIDLNLIIQKRREMFKERFGIYSARDE